MTIAAGIGYWIGRDHEHRARLDDQDDEPVADVGFTYPEQRHRGFQGGGPPTPPSPPAAGAAAVQQVQATVPDARKNRTDGSAARKLVRDINRTAARHD